MGAGDGTAQSRTPGTRTGVTMQHFQQTLSLTQCPQHPQNTALLNSIPTGRSKPDLCKLLWHGMETSTPPPSTQGQADTSALQKLPLLNLSKTLPRFSTSHRHNKHSGCPSFCCHFSPFLSLKVQQNPARGRVPPAPPTAAPRSLLPLSCFLYLCSTNAYLKSKTRAVSTLRVQPTTEEPNGVILL